MTDPAIPTFRKKPPKRVKTPKIFNYEGSIFEFNKLNPITKAKDGPQYTFGYGLVEQIVAFWAFESGQLGKIAKFVHDYQLGLDSIASIPFEIVRREEKGRKFLFAGTKVSRPMHLLLILFRNHWYAIFDKIDFPEKGRSYLNNLVASRFRVCQRLLQLKLEALKAEDAKNG